jgi:mlo protein
MAGGGGKAAAGGGEAPAITLEHTPTWIVSAVCFVIVIISLLFERLLHRLGKVYIRRCSSSYVASVFELMPPCRSIRHEL